MDYLDKDFYKKLDSLILSSIKTNEIIKSKNIKINLEKERLIEFSNKFSYLCRKYELDLTKRADFCQKLNKQVKELYSSEKDNKNFFEKDDELILIFCVFICDNACLMDYIYNYGQQKKITKENIVDFVQLKDYANTLTALIKDRRIQKECFNSILNTLPLKTEGIKISYNSVNEKEKKKILDIFKNYFGSTKFKNSINIIEDNIEHILKILHSNSNLKKLAPLFIFEVLKEHKNRISKIPLEFHINKLFFKFKNYMIEKDNKKNFNSYCNMCIMYLNLIEYYKNFEYVDLDLCNYGFYSISNLCDWYYYIFLSINDTTDKNIIKIIEKFNKLNNEYFLIPMEYIICDCNVTYFKYGLLDCLVYKEYYIDKNRSSINLKIKNDNLSVHIYKNISDNDCMEFIKIYSKKDIFTSKEFIKTVINKIEFPTNIINNNIDFIYAATEEALFYKTNDLLNEIMTNTGKTLIFENI